MSRADGLPAARPTEMMLDRVDRHFSDCVGGPSLAEAQATARPTALALIDAAAFRPGDDQAALLLYAGELLVALGIELAAHPERTAQLIARLVDAAGLPRLGLAHEVLRAPELLQLPSAVAIEVQLGLMQAVAPLQSVSLWMLEAERVHCVSRNGGERGEAAENLAARLLTGTDSRSVEQGPMIGVAVDRFEQRAAALIGRAEGHQRVSCLPVIEEGLPIVVAILERDELIARNANAERTLVDTHERRLTRAGFDIHDGPLQDLVLLAEDLQQLRRQLIDVLPHHVAPVVLGRMDDIDAELVAVDSHLRGIAAAVRSPFNGEYMIPEALRQLTEAFAAQSGVTPVLQIEGDLETVTDSQRLALLSIVREALNNVREHSRASEVAVTVIGRPATIEAQIDDNGIGFDVEQALMRAARGGRLGLAGLHERARLLGGSLWIDSCHGGPTSLSVTLERWQPSSPEPGTSPGLLGTSAGPGTSPGPGTDR